MKKPRLFICLIISLALLVAVSSYATFAWLAANRRVTDDGLDLQIDSDSLVGMPMMTYWFQEKDEKDESTDSEYKKSSGAQIELPVYDSVFVEDNDDCRVYLRIPVFGKTVNDGTAFTVTLSIESKDPRDDIFETNHNYYSYNEKKEETDSIALLLSNVINVKFGTIPTLNDTEDDDENAAETIVKGAKAFFNPAEGTGTAPTAQTFFSTGTEAAAQETKLTEISFTIENYEDDRKELTVSDETAYLLYLYFEISYNDELVEQMMETWELELGDTSFDITSDLDKFVLDIN